MNILVINGSPKNERSNTLRLTKSFLEGLNSADKTNTNVIEILHVGKLNINPCMGCFTCWDKTPGKCAINDDMTFVIEKKLWADLIIHSFPLYRFSVPGPLKTLIDRSLPMFLPFMNPELKYGGHPLRYDTSDKRYMYISTAGLYGSKGIYDAVKNMSIRIDKKGKNTIFCGQGELFKFKELRSRTNEYLSYVKQAGKEYAFGSISEETRKNLNKLLYPRENYEKFADATWGIEKDTGKKVEEALVFTRQMAALYNKNNYPGQDMIVEMNYTDIDRAYRMILANDGSNVTEDLNGSYTTRINTPLHVWRDIASGKIRGNDALAKHLFTVEGDFDLLNNWSTYFLWKSID